MKPEHKMLLSQRIQALIDAVGGREAAARIMAVTTKTVTDWKNDPDKIRLTKLVSLLKAASAPMEYLEVIDPSIVMAFPRDSGMRSQGQAGYETELPKNEGNYRSSELVEIPLYDVQLSAGSGSIESQVDIIDQLSFSLSFLEGLGIGSTENAGLFRVAGDSMEPSAPDHSLVIVNTMEQEIVDGIYAIGVDGQARIKRLRKRVTGELEIISDNELYGTETLSGEDLNLVTIIGRVRCIIKWL